MLFGFIILFVLLAIVGLSIADSKVNRDEADYPGDLYESEWWDQ